MREKMTLRKWTQSERDELRDLYVRWGADLVRIGHHLDRTPDSITGQVHRMGLRRGTVSLRGRVLEDRVVRSVPSLPAIPAPRPPASETSRTRGDGPLPPSAGAGARVGAASRSRLP